MSMLDFILFIVIGVGITNLVVNATILDNLRVFVADKSEPLGTLVSCMMCTGFWVGFLISGKIDIFPIYGGAIISLFSQVFGGLVDYLELKIAINNYVIEEVEEE